MDFIKKLDVYRKLPSDFVQPTYSGAMLSIISMVVMLILFLSEFFTYLEVKIGSEMTIDVNRGGEKLMINVDLTLHRFPCSLLSIDIQDVMGSHTVNVHGTLTKNKLDKAGRVIGQEIYRKAQLNPILDHDEDNHGNDEEMPDLSLVKAEIDAEEGCQVFGHFFVNKVPGNFHVSAHAYGKIIQKIASMGLFRFDVAHTINHISFGDDRELKNIKKNFKEGVLNPLDGVQRMDREKKVYEYYLKVVPTTYTDLYQNNYYVHQFTASNNEVISHMLPAVYFRFDLSPITVKYWQYKEDFSHFFVQICAIIGGIFAITGILDGIIHKSVLYMLKKSSME